MPITCPGGKKAKFRYRRGTKMRLAICPRGKGKRGRVVEVKNMATGAVHTQEEFARGRRQGRRSQGRGGRR